MPTDLTNVKYVAIAIAIAVVLLAVANWAYYKYYFVPTQVGNDSLFNRQFLSFMPGLKRQDLEEYQLDEELWSCSVCDFQNLHLKPVCLLCGTRRDTRFIEIHGVSTPAKPATVVRSSSSNYLQVTSTRASSLHATASRIYSMAFENVVLPEDLNAQQRSARMRKQWVRLHDVHGVVRWTRRFLDAAQVPDAHVIQMNTPPLPSTPPPSSSGNLSPVVESPRTTHQSSIDCASPNDLLQKLHQAPTEDCHVIMWQPLDTTPANVTVLGSVVPPATASSLLEISKLPFYMKYAWFLHQVHDLVVPYDELHIKVKVMRDAIVQEAVENLLSYPPRALCAIVRYEFTGESAQDAGAVQREWYMLVSEGLLVEANGLFVVLNREDNSYFINPNSSHAWRHPNHMDHLKAFHAVGRFLGRSLLDGQVIPMHLSPVLLKAILGVPLTLDDVEGLDRTVHKGLLYLLDHDNAQDLALTFSVSETHGHNTVVEVELVENGHLRAVTDANKAEYVRLMVRYLVFGRVEAQLSALLQGVYDVVPPELLMPFDHKEFELILCGLAEVDVADWKANTVTSSNLDNSSPLQWFWEVVEAMSPVDRSRLLQFATGSSRVPVQGFKGLTSYDGEICRFTLKGVPYEGGAYPATHACYNRIDLPLYPTKDMMKEALTMLLLSDPTGFTIE
ncbi:hypothetical protein, variant 1 [Aphanomyces astaci]|uniref:HECT-type E3 ubiquitin transferase n=2 Tax=Aphanomyces astaci TaxID=112090 RepID=W4FYD0_APHAT|nr:hypothetical protein, variant 1 [Aphanomyces astaci]ETV71663.1 hypothetical protein, variant 1 [Aphanomyces astaci]|eukprot:XP_009838854.1 hypothetical protein, variant 1 [Aphanomyces astaci]